MYILEADKNLQSFLQTKQGSQSPLYSSIPYPIQKDTPSSPKDTPSFEEVLLKDNWGSLDFSPLVGEYKIPSIESKTEEEDMVES